MLDHLKQTLKHLQNHTLNQCLEIQIILPGGSLKSIIPINKYGIAEKFKSIQTIQQHLTLSRVVQQLNYK